MGKQMDLVLFWGVFVFFLGGFFSGGVLEEVLK